MTKFMSKSNNCNQSAIIFRIILCSGISLVLGAVLGHLLRTELFADINAEFEKRSLKSNNLKQFHSVDKNS